MPASKPLIEFTGFVSHADITKLINAFTNEAEELKISKSLYKKIIVIMIEILENSFHYLENIKKDIPEKITPPYFSISQSEKSFRLISVNPIKTKHVSQLKKRIEMINNCESVFLKELYLKKLIESMSSNNPSPGVGLIRIAKITKNKIKCSFNHFDNKFLNYKLEIIVNS